MALKLTIVCVAAVLMAIRGRADEIGLAANTTSYQDNEGSIGDGDVSVDFEQGRSNQAQAESASTGTCNSREEHSEIAKLAEELAETKKQLADIVAAQTQQQAASSSHAVHAQAELSTLTDQLQKADAAQTQLGEDRASDLCAANERVLKRDVELPEGLWGVNLTVGVVDIRPFAMVDSKAPYGVGDGLRFGGPVVLVFDTMAKQHGVQVTYVAMPPIDRDSTTITEYLLEHAPQYDLLMGPFIRDSQRTRRGLMFTEGIVDYTLGLYMKRKFMSSDFKDSLWLLVRPFDASGWFVVLGVIGFPILATIIMRGTGAATDAAVQSILVLCGVSGPLANWPRRSRAAGVVMLSWAYMVLITKGLYQSSMQRSLVPSEETSSLDGFKGELCVSRNLFNEGLVEPFYTGLMQGIPRDDLPQAVFNGTCDAMVERRAFAELMMAGALPEKQGEQPYGCHLKPVGRPIIRLPGCHVVHDGPCNELIVEVVSSWVHSQSSNSPIQQEIAKVIEDRRQHCPEVSNALLSEQLYSIVLWFLIVAALVTCGVPLVISVVRGR